MSVMTTNPNSTVLVHKVESLKEIHVIYYEDDGCSVYFITLILLTSIKSKKSYISLICTIFIQKFINLFFVCSAVKQAILYILIYHCIFCIAVRFGNET